MTEDESPPNEDIYVDLDSPLATKIVPLDYESDCSCDSSHTSIPSDTWMDESDIQVLSPEPERDAPASTSSAVPVLSEINLKKAEMDLYVELLSDEIANKESNLMNDPKYKELHDELMKTKTLLSEREAEISDLTNQNINLKKNICSLYKTAKAEIEQKDEWLAGANEKVNRYHSEKYFRIDFTSQSTQTDLIESAYATSNDPTNNKNCLKDSRESYEKRKPSSLPQENISTKNDQVAKKRKLDECNSTVSETTVPKDFDLEINKELSELHRKFNLLPEEVKSSFKEHEQGYISSLNKLKQSLINSFLNQSKDQTHGEIISSTDPSVKSPMIAKSSETNILPGSDKNLYVSKHTPLPSERINPGSNCDKNSKDERANTYNENPSETGNERPPSNKNPHNKRTDSAREKPYDRAGYPSTSTSSKRGEVHKYESRYHYRPREPSVSRTYAPNYFEHRKRSLYSKNRYSRPPCSPVGKNTSASLTIYKIRKERDLKRQLSLSQKKFDET